MMQELPSMATSNFDIYEADGRFVAITNDVRRTILDALTEGDKQLADLVEVTGKAKATLSSIHLKELLDQQVVKARSHPDDNRKKLFHLAGSKIGSSNIPIDQLREAVKEYVTLAPQAARFPLSITFDALAAGDDVAKASLRKQARRLGLLVGSVLEGDTERDLLIEVSDLLEREGLASPVRLEMQENDALIIERGASSPEGLHIERLAALIAGFLDGVLDRRGLAGVQAEVTDTSGSDRFTLSFGTP